MHPRKVRSSVSLLLKWALEMACLKRAQIQLQKGMQATLPQIHMEADRGPYIEDSGLVVGSSPLPCYLGQCGNYKLLYALQVHRNGSHT